MKSRRLERLPGGYRVIYADPPWLHSGGKNGAKGWSKTVAADAHYPLMRTPAIMALGDLVTPRCHPDGAHLYLWAINNLLPEAFRVMEAWGFRYVTTITWVKAEVVQADGRLITLAPAVVKQPHVTLNLGKKGIGKYHRGQTEHLLFGVRGRLPYRRLEGKIQQGETLIIAPRGRHSAKPDEAYGLIEHVSRGPGLELFARRERKGWDSWGNEL
jgi:N6-adenosine-specific RNA methylase IME4